MEILVQQIDNIVIPENRQRRVFDQQKLIDLRRGIQSKGLMHPIVVRDDGITLTAGERRLRACRLLMEDLLPIVFNGSELPMGCVPCVKLGTLSEDDLVEAELEENVLREDLTIQERALAIQKLHKLRGRQAQAEGRVQTITATASEILGKPAQGAQVTEVSDALLVAEYADDPEVAKARSLKEAARIVTRKLEREFAEANADSIPTDSVVAGHKVLFGTADQALVAYSKFFDCAIVDPPYGVGADTWTAQSGSEAGTKHEYTDDPEKVDAAVRAGLAALTTAMKDHAHLYMFCDIRRYSMWAQYLIELKWNVWYRPLIWSKMGQGMLMGNANGPRSTYETIIFAQRGWKKVTKVAPDVLNYPPVQGRLHAAQKPIDLYVDLLSRSCYPGEQVVDCFMGSGTIFPAATQLKVFATGCDVDPRCIEIATERLKKGEFESDDQTDSLAF